MNMNMYCMWLGQTIRNFSQNPGVMKASNTAPSRLEFRGFGRSKP